MTAPFLGASRTRLSRFKCCHSNSAILHSTALHTHRRMLRRFIPVILRHVKGHHFPPRAPGRFWTSILGCLALEARQAPSSCCRSLMADEVHSAACRWISRGPFSLPRWCWVFLSLLVLVVGVLLCIYNYYSMYILTVCVNSQRPCQVLHPPTQALFSTRPSTHSLAPEATPGRT